jgi:serine/threonine protein kinase
MPHMHAGAAATARRRAGETGSYRYMAPEVFLHEPYNANVDVYSFAMICFQLFEGAAPFEGVDAFLAAQQAALHNLRPQFSPLPPNTPNLAVREVCIQPLCPCSVSFCPVRVLRVLRRHSHFCSCCARPSSALCSVRLRAVEATAHAASAARHHAMLACHALQRHTPRVSRSACAACALRMHPLSRCTSCGGFAP